MFHQLVVAIDGSEFAAQALPVATKLAAAADVHLRVLGIARTDAELAWTYDHVVSDAQRAGVDVANVDVRVDPDPTGVLLAAAADERNVLCLASHLRSKPASMLLHAVGSRVIERAPRPVLVVGPNAAAATAGFDVVVALDGVSDPQPLLEAGTTWARRLRTALRLVTVYEPVLAEVGDPTLFVRHWGTSYDPNLYLESISERLDDAGLSDVKAVAIRNMDGPAFGLAEHLSAAPARLLVAGADDAPSGVVRHLVETITAPILVVNGNG
jgi:nucleotide-binding universal stress UspA family protein